MMLEPNYIKVECEEMRDITPEIKDIGKEILAWARERDRTHKDCAAVAAPQLGLGYRLAAFVSKEHTAWHVASNLYLMDERESDEEFQEMPIPLFNFPKKYVLFNIYETALVSYLDIMSGEVFEETVRGHDAIVAQVMCTLLDGKELKIVNKDFRTILKSESRVGRNTPCKCGSGKKFKQCCIRSTAHGNGNDNVTLSDITSAVPPLQNEVYTPFARFENDQGSQPHSQDLL